MSRFAEVVQQDTPRLVVMFQTVEGKETFQWGVLGAIPILTLIGCINRVQTRLATDAWMEECDQSALVIAWDEAEREFNVFLHPDVPRDSLSGMLETVKHAITSSQMAARAANQQVILGPDGQPARRGGM